MATQLEHINPIALIHVGEQQEGYGDEQHDGPAVRNAESALSQRHQEQPPAAEQQDTQPGKVQELREPHAYPREQATRYHQLFAEEKM